MEFAMRVTEIYCIKPFHVLNFFPPFACDKTSVSAPQPSAKLGNIYKRVICCTLLTSCSIIFTGYFIMFLINADEKKTVCRESKEHASKTT